MEIFFEVDRRSVNNEMVKRMALYVEDDEDISQSAKMSAAWATTRDLYQNNFRLVFERQHLSIG